MFLPKKGSTRISPPQSIPKSLISTPKRSLHHFVTYVPVRNILKGPFQYLNKFSSTFKILNLALLSSTYSLKRNPSEENFLM